YCLASPGLPAGAVPCCTQAALTPRVRWCGGRDHSTVMHGVRRIGDLIREDREVFNVVQELTARIKRTR
ncbi:MAG: hypothetical protein ABJB93_09060, partial [Gaiellales bacterium]